jgi:hypothetical protein
VPKPKQEHRFKVTGIDCKGDVIVTSIRNGLSGDDVIAHVYHFVQMWNLLDKGLPVEYPGGDLPVQVIVYREAITKEEKAYEPRQDN